MSTARTLFWLIFLIIVIGLVLRYGMSSDLLARDFNGILQTLTLQNATGYYGPTQTSTGGIKYA